jgi:hypothetical protein
MASGVDNVSNVKGKGPVGPAPHVRSVGPEADRRAARGRRGTDQAGEAFSAALNEVGATAEKISPEYQAQVRKAERAAAAQILARAEKRPASAPPEIAAEEGERLYVARMAEATRQPDNSEKPETLKVPSSNEFIQAASKYADRFFSVTKAYSKPGESLELSA